MNGTTLEAKSKIIESSWTKLNHGGDRMTIEEILAGESKNVEFKVQRPDKSMKYMKTVVAFANGKLYLVLTIKQEKLLAFRMIKFFGRLMRLRMLFLTVVNLQLSRMFICKI